MKNAPLRRESTGELDLLPDHLDAISRTLLPRYQEVANEMAPFRQRTIYEANPDLSFFEMNDENPMQWSKRSVRGVEERRSLLERRIQGVHRVIDVSLAGVFLSHLLDAAAILWTARRISTRTSVRLPVDPEWDDGGLRMELIR